MAKKDKKKDKRSCSFCGKTEEQVRKLIAGPGELYICDECVELCDEIIQEEFAETAELMHEEIMGESTTLSDDGPLFIAIGIDPDDVEEITVTKTITYKLRSKR